MLLNLLGQPHVGTAPNSHERAAAWGQSRSEGNGWAPPAASGRGHGRARASDLFRERTRGDPNFAICRFSNRGVRRDPPTAFGSKVHKYFVVNRSREASVSRKTNIYMSVEFVGLMVNGRSSPLTGIHRFLQRASCSLHTMAFSRGAHNVSP